MNELQDYELLVFDLDNTLYLEIDYLFPGYRRIGNYLEQLSLCSSDQIYEFLTENFLAGHRTDLFNRMERAFSLQVEMGIYLEIIRTTTFETKLKLIPKGGDLLEYGVRAQREMAILTNGNIQQQKNKIKHIDWRGHDQHLNFYFAAEVAAKPSPLALIALMKDLNRNAQETIFIGDSDIDERCAESAEVKYIHANDVELVELACSY